MSSPGNGRHVVYEVSISGQTGAYLKQLHAQAAEKGQGHRFVAALRQILERLKNAPRELGEPMFRLPAARVTMSKAIVPPLVVHFGVHDELPLVFVTQFIPLS
jgi:hypothetical protein